MVKKFVLFLGFLVSFVAQAQIDSLYFSHKKIQVQDSLIFNPVSTPPYYFRVTTAGGKALDSTQYKVDFKQSVLFLKPDFYKQYPKVDSLYVRYYNYPEYWTQTYSGYNPNLIIPNNSLRRPTATVSGLSRLTKKPFSGLDTKGSIVRGVNLGNNQDAVLNSTLDLTIQGKLSSKVTLKAHINDTNIPIQENGYSQDLKDLDRVFIEMEAPQWHVQAGDIFLNNQDTYFMNFTKKVSGISLNAQIDSTRFFTSGALVKGRFASYRFQGEEANQGPYKLKGTNGEAYIFIINASEKVYINGILQKRGRDQDYWIDYNTAEITFTPTNPITSDQRIRVEFQYSDRNYSRFVTSNGVTNQGNKLQWGVYFYRETDLKNQPLQIQLTEEQKALLALAGNTDAPILVSNVVETPYTENTILYRKITTGSNIIYEYTTDPTETLYQVGFTYVGAQQGDYRVAAYLATGKKMEYVGANQGNYVAASPLVAPSRQQIAVFNTQYHPSDKTQLAMEFAYSNNDSNLFSEIGNNHNKAPAVKINWQQSILDTTATGWLLQGGLQLDYLHKDFKSIERVFAVEFNRDWNLTAPQGNQSLLRAQIQLNNTKKGTIAYHFENLNFSENYQGNKHALESHLQFNNFRLQHLSSYLQSNGNLTKTQFARSHTGMDYSRKKWWVGTVFDLEQNKQKTPLSNQLNNLSYRFSDIQARLGIGDTARVYLAVGARFHTNDSLRDNRLQRVNQATSLFFDSQLIQSKQSQLKWYANYRKIDYLSGNHTKSLNSQLVYKQALWNQLLHLQTLYTTTSGNSPQQEYAYIETAPGQGYYTWIDYNENGIQELDEFEVAQFSDQANYLRIALPNIQYIATQEARLQQSVQLNFSQWANLSGIKKTLSHWSDQLQILAKNNKKRERDIWHLNPFDFKGTSVLELQYNMRNSLFFNKGIAHYSTTYHYTDLRQKTLHLFDIQENDLVSHQLQFQHKIKEVWLLGFDAIQSQNKRSSSAFSNRNYRINTRSFSPYITYLITKNHWIKIRYAGVYKKNETGENARLQKDEWSLEYLFTNTKETRFSTNIKYLKNNFSGNGFSALGYQMLEGLQPGNNLVINLLWTHKINSFLFLNLNYNARANTISRTIHNGNVQLRAVF